MSMHKDFSRIQQELKAPKGQVNKFGGYKYRSCEDILEAVKPLLGDNVLIINDEIVQIGDRYYVKATARFIGGSSCIEASAFAREPLNKKGSDESQITGAASSYARKYALNGLFCIDDTKDADAINDHGKKQIKHNPKHTADYLLELINQSGTEPSDKTCDWADKLSKDELRTHILAYEKKLKIFNG